MSVIIPNYRSIGDLLKGKQYNIDEYQREYKWDRENIAELIDDLCSKFYTQYKAGHAPKEVPTYDGYFLGSIIISQKQGQNFLIDGQQRITSLTLLMIFLFHRMKSENQPCDDLKQLIYSDNYGVPCYNLNIPERFDILNALYEKKDFSPDGYDDSIRNMWDRYSDLNDEFPDQLNGEALVCFKYWLVNRVGLIEISTDNDDYAYTVFESMNDRGQPLSSTDLLKAYLLAFVSEPGRRSQLNKTWKEQIQKINASSNNKDRDAKFITAWLRAQYAQNIRDRKADAVKKDWENISNAYHRWVKDNKKLIGLTDTQSYDFFISTKFRKFSLYTDKIQDAMSTLTPGLESVFYNAHNEFTLQQTVLLAPLDESDDEPTIVKKLQVTASYLDIFLMRRSVNYMRIGYSAMEYSMFTLIRDIRRKKLEDLVEILKSKLNSDEVNFDGAKGKDRYGLDDFRLNMFSSRKIFHILARITAWVEVKSKRPNKFAEYIDRSSADPYDIEHIWADHHERFRDSIHEKTDFDRQRNHIAGLLLLPASFNRSFSDKSFEEKVLLYSKQNLWAASLSTASYKNDPGFLQFIQLFSIPLQGYDHFGLIEQKERQIVLKSICNQIWNPERLVAEAGL